MSNINELKDKIVHSSLICGIVSNEVALAKDLVENKYKGDDLFVCEGLWAVEKLIQKNIKVTHFLFNGENLDDKSEKDLKLIAKMCKYSLQSFSISAKACKKISDREGYDEYFIICQMPQYSLDKIEKSLSGKDEILAIIMDGLEQPGNIGAILRSFDCAGGQIAFITNRKARLNNSRLVRASLGASFMLPVLEVEIDELQKWLEKNNFKNIVTDLTATKSYRDIRYSGRIAVVAGNEHTGISPSWRQCPNSQSIIIPMLGSCESLNVGFASTLVCYEAGLKKFKESIKK